jgi:hypothetical protein
MITPVKIDGTIWKPTIYEIIHIDTLVKVSIRRLCKKSKIKACAISKNAAYLAVREILRECA